MEYFLSFLAILEQLQFNRLREFFEFLGGAEQQRVCFIPIVFLEVLYLKTASLSLFRRGLLFDAHSIY